jgi:micrococcal nuclease
LSRLVGMSKIIAAFLVIQATVLSVHDGDTLTVDAGAGPQTVRILNIDTPEMPPLAKCDGEAIAARAARQALIELAPPGSTVTLHAGERLRDKYGRILATVELPTGDDAGQRLINDGFARPWRGHREPWCTLPGGLNLPEKPPEGRSKASFSPG